MDEKNLQVFIASVGRYFQTTFQEAALVDPPFLQGEQTVMQDFTGMIGISGSQKGAVYFTASRAMVDAMLGQLRQPLSDEKRADIVGEVANTISGNARREYGKDFHISVPIVLQGKVEALTLPRNAAPFVIPFIWRGHRAHLIVAIVAK